jgi:hypothetical protein
VSKVKVMASNPSIACPEYSRALRSRATDLVGHKHVDHTDQHYVACLKAMHKGLDSVGWDRYVFESILAGSASPDSKAPKIGLWGRKTMHW